MQIAFKTHWSYNNSRVSAHKGPAHHINPKQLERALQETIQWIINRLK